MTHTKNTAKSPDKFRLKWKLLHNTNVGEQLSATNITCYCRHPPRLPTSTKPSLCRTHAAYAKHLQGL